MEGHQLNFCKNFSTQVIGRVNVPNLKSGDKVQIYPFSIKGEEISVRKIKKGQPVGQFITVNLMYLCLEENQKQEIAFVKDLEKNPCQDFSLVRVNESLCAGLLSVNPGDQVKIWFYTLEASVGIKKKKGLYTFYFHFPITVAIEKLGAGEILMVDLNDLILGVKQKEKIKEILSQGIKSLMKSLRFTKKETEFVDHRLPKILEHAFMSEEAVLAFSENYN
ncbi:MAG: hypothetical protein WCK59_01400 [Candidatus Falkowbacteria bacterium]